MNKRSKSFTSNYFEFNNVDGVGPLSCVPYNGVSNLVGSGQAKGDTSTAEKIGPAKLFFPSHPTKDEWADIVAANRSGLALTGTAALERMGPTLGLIDIAECDDAYLFRVSLPGVKRDANEFSCEVVRDGKVMIRGVTTTGEKTVIRFAQLFEMQTQNLCPPGPFSISFQLPGPVDPQQFSSNMGIDGIFEVIVMKARGAV